MANGWTGSWRRIVRRWGGGDDGSLNDNHTNRQSRKTCKATPNIDSEWPLNTSCWVIPPPTNAPFSIHPPSKGRFNYYNNPFIIGKGRANSKALPFSTIVQASAPRTSNNNKNEENFVNFDECRKRENITSGKTTESGGAGEEHIFYSN